MIYTHILSGNFEYKKYRSNPEQLRQNQSDKEVQRERDERARNQSNSSASKDESHLPRK
jgi:hypothetical protein